MKLKKILFAACAATMLFAGATIASAAPELVVDYNETASTENQAVVDIYYKNYGDFSIDLYQSLTVQLNLMDGTTNVNKTYFDTATVDCALFGGGSASAMLNNSTKSLQIVGSQGNDIYGYLAWEEGTGRLATFTINLLKPIDKELTFAVQMARYKTTAVTSNQNVTAQTLDTVKPVNVGPTTVTTNGTLVQNATAEEGETYIEDSEDAVAYWAEGAFTSGKSSAYWTANFGTDAMKYNLANVGNLSGNVKLGIVITGAANVSDVKLNVVTTN